MSLARKSFLTFFTALGVSWGQLSEGQDLSSLNEGSFVFEELIVEAESLEDEEPLRVEEVPQIIEEPILEPAPIENEEEPSPLFAPPSATSLAGEELQRALKATLGETLAGQPGISASSYTPGVSRPIIRGLDGFRVATLVDGLSSLDLSQESPDHGVSIDTGLAEALEIYRGPSALRFGSGAIGGAVNTVTRLRPTLAPEGEWETSVSAGFDSQGEAIRGSLRAKLADGPWAVGVYGLSLIHI